MNSKITLEEWREILAKHKFQNGILSIAKGDQSFIEKVINCNVMITNWLECNNKNDQINSKNTL